MNLTTAVATCALLTALAPWPTATASAAQGRRARELPVAGETGVIEGVVYDPLGIPMPDVVLFLGGVEVFGTARTDPTGHYRFSGVPAGRHGIISTIDFFPAFEVDVTRGASVTKDMALKISPVAQLFTVCARCGWSLEIPDSLAKEFASDATAALDQPVSAPKPINGWEYYKPGMGLYPAVAVERELEGTVIVEGRIGIDGVPTDLKVVSATDGELAKAAVDTLSLEFWEPGRIRGVPFEVPFRFLIRYVLTE
jgi:hypothetical protein